MNRTAADELFANFTFSQESPPLLTGFEEGYAQGFDAAVAHVEGLIFLLVLSYVLQIILIGIGRRLEMREAWYDRVLPTIRHAAFVFQFGICLALLTRTYLLY